MSVTCGSTTVTPTVTKLTTSSTEVRYKLTISNYPGGVVTINIDEGALVDTSNNKSNAETITLPEKDTVRPTLAIQNPEYSSSENTYTFEIIATDNIGWDSDASFLSASGTSQNITITCSGGAIETPTISVKEVTTKQITYQVTISNYPSGTVNVAIDAGAIRDADGNGNNSTTITLPALDVAKPVWQDNPTIEYNETDQTLDIVLSGKDETALNNSQSTLTLGTNIIIYVGGQVIDSSNVEFGTTTISADQLTKTFPITLKNYTGGIVEISISTGALKDNSGKISDSKTYTFTDVIRPMWSIEEPVYDPVQKAYTVKVIATDDTSIATVDLANNIELTVNGIEVTPTVNLIEEENKEKYFL